MSVGEERFSLTLAADELVLIVEHDEARRNTVERALERHGCAFRSFADGKEALEQADLSRVALAIVAMHSPGIDGMAIGRQLKERCGNSGFVPVLLLDGLDVGEARMEDFRASCDDILTRPIHHFELVVRVASLLERRRQHSQLLTANKLLREGLEKKRELAALVVHDLRNPLAAIHGNAQLLQEDADPENELFCQSLHDIEVLTTKVLSMVAGLLDVEELEEGILTAARVDLDVAEFVAQFPAGYQIATEARKLDMQIDTSPGLRASFDPALIGRVVENLLDNSVRYAPRKGRVELRAFADGNDLVLQVGNDGPPISDAEHERIFGRYYRLEARRAGARANRGLGLYFCRLAAEAHEGSIVVAEIKDLPACFVLRLPDAVLGRKPASDES